jgi:hypothetical protein
MHMRLHSMIIPAPQASPGTARKIKHLFLCFAALLPLLSALITSYHYHADMKISPDCAVCKSAQDLSSGDQQELLSLKPQEFVVMSSCSEDFNSVHEILTFSLTTRAPPFHVIFANHCS